MSKFYVVSSEILPEVLEKVIEAQTMLQSGQVRRISEAVKAVGISRGTFYKYKDAVFSFNQNTSTRKAIISATVQDETGALSRLLTMIATRNVNVLALNQTIPINGIANVTLTLDINDLEISIHELLQLLQDLPIVKKADLVAVE